MEEKENEESMPISEKKSVDKKICNSCGKETDEYVKVTNWNYICLECLEREKEEKIQKEIQRAIPLKYQKIETTYQELVKKKENRSLFLWGETGVGKTVFACSMLKKYIRQGKEGKFISYPAFIMELQSAYRENENNPFDMAVEVAKFKGWLVLDDIGVSKTTDYVKQITYFIINEREQQLLPLIITSNFSLDRVDEMIGTRISSRIAGICEIIKLRGKDKRNG